MAEWRAYDKDDPLTLDEACVYYRNVFRPATLRAARDRDELEIERLGNKDFVTIRAIEAWRALCRGKLRVQGSFGANRVAPTGNSPTEAGGSSETEQSSLAQAAAMATAKALSKPSRSTSRKSISHRASADVIPLKS